MTKQKKAEQDKPEFKITKIPVPPLLKKTKPECTRSNTKLWFALVVFIILFLQAVATISVLQERYDSLDESHWKLIEAINTNPDNYENITK